MELDQSTNEDGRMAGWPDGRMARLPLVFRLRSMGQSFFEVKESHQFGGPTKNEEAPTMFIHALLQSRSSLPQTSILP